MKKMQWHRVLALVMTLCMLLSMSPVSAFAEEGETAEVTTVAEGTDGTLTWVLDSQGKLTVSGTGAVQSTASWNTHKDAVKELVLGEGITDIGRQAFENYTALTAVSLPATVTHIRVGAFRGCSALTSVVVPTGVCNIGGQAFANCTALLCLTLPNTLGQNNGRLWEEVCDGCTSLKCVHFTGTAEEWEAMPKGDPATEKDVGETLLNAYTTPQLTHVDEVPSTCQTQGTAAHDTCPGCGKLYRDNAEVTAEALKLELGDHSFADGECTVCGEKEFVDPDLHTYTNGFCAHGAECEAYYEEPALEGGVYQISNAGQLYWFAQKVNAGANEYKESNGEVYNAVLTQDITINAQVLENGELVADTSALRAWTPIGLYTSYDKYIGYSGTFDGQGHTVSGLFLKNKSQKHVGLFGHADADSTIQNVGILDSYVGADECIGAVVGYTMGTVTSCYNAGVVEDLNDRNIGSYLGGVVGDAFAATVTGCYNTGKVKAVDVYAGGVVGGMSGTVTDCYNTGTVVSTDESVGGVVGYALYATAESRATITNCYNTGAVTGAGKVGGVAGYISYTDLSHCYNTGAVTAVGTKSFHKIAGGVVGDNYSTSVVQDCYNTGSVTGNVQAVGGVVGENWATVTNCYNTGAVTGTTAEELTGSGTLVGGVAGRNFSGTYTNCYYLTDCAADGNGVKQLGIGNSTLGQTTEDTDKTVAKTAEQFASGEVAYLLNGSTSEGELVWKQDLPADASPKFVGGTVYSGYRGCALTYANSAEGLSQTAGEHTWTDATCSAPKTCSVCHTTQGDPLPHSFADGVCETCGTPDPNGKLVAIGTGEDSEVYTDESGYYVGADTSALNTDVATVTITGEAGEPTRTLSDALTALESGKQYLLVHNRANKPLTNEASGSQMSMTGSTESYTDAAIWTITAVDGGYTVQDAQGKYLTIGASTAELSDNSVTLTLTYNSELSVWDIAKDGQYLNQFNGENSSVAAGWQDGAATDFGSRWRIYQVITTQTGTSRIQFHGVAAGKTSVTIGSTNYYITVAMDEAHTYENGFCQHPECDAPYEAATLNAEGVYEIANGGQLYWFAQKVNAGENTISGKLTGDITINAMVLDDTGALVSDTDSLRAWTPISTVDVHYMGTFDGAEHTISGLYFNDTTSDTGRFVGMFGYVENGTVKNVTLSQSYVQGDQNVGGIVGYGLRATVTNCHNTSVVTGSSGIGGVVGSIYDGTVENCTNSGAISGEKYGIGGVVGDTYSNHDDAPNTVKNCTNSGTVTCTYEGTKSADIYLGGIVGKNGEGVVTNCSNTGTLTNNGKGGYTGGIIGYNNFTSGGPAVVSDCTNSGTVTGRSSVGGIIGRSCHEDNLNVAVTNCHNTGAVNGTADVGGVIGYVNTTHVANCSNSGTVTSTGRAGGLFGILYGGGTRDKEKATAERCYNTGNVTGGKEVGGIAGNMQKSVTTDCYTVGAISGDSLVGGLVGKNSDKASMTRCHNYGTVEGTGTNVGAIAGFDNKKGTYTNVYYLAEEETDALTGTEFKTATQFASGEVTYLLNGEKSEGELVWKQTLTGDAYPKFEGKTVYFDDQNNTYCNELPQPEVDTVIRLEGQHRHETSLKTADEMKEVLGVEKFDTIIVADGYEFYDALSGSYLAAVKKAPILLSYSGDDKYAYLNDNNLDYIKENLAEGGKVYILGGEKAVPDLYENKLDEYDIKYKRLGGGNRFDTNLKILEEAGIPAGSEILVCTSSSFADSLSAAATGKPILLVWNERGSLYGNQTTFLSGLENCTFTIIGGEGAVREEFEEVLGGYGKVVRLAGDNRLQTSVAVAEKYFQNVDQAVLAYAWEFPDGLCGGSLAYAMKAPLILTMTGLEGEAVKYATENGITSGIVLGGAARISDASVREIFAMAEDAEITVK